MVRPIYESSKNIDNEKIAAKEIARVIGCNVMRNKKLCAFDYSFIKDNNIKAIGEIKVRSCFRNQYKTFFISADKVLKCKEFASTFDIKFLLFVWWGDGIYMLDVMETSHDYLDIGGRTDRGDAQDIEPMVHYSVEKFKLVVIPS